MQKLLPPIVKKQLQRPKTLKNEGVKESKDPQKASRKA